MPRLGSPIAATLLLQHAGIFSGLLGFYTDHRYEELLHERSELKAKLYKAQRPDLLDTVRLSLNHLEGYYVLSKVQARLSFLAGIAAMSAGMVALLAGGYYALTLSAPTAIVVSVGGLTLQFVAGAFLYLHRLTLHQMNRYHGVLVRVQDVLLAIRVVEEMHAGRDELLRRIVERLLDSKSDA